MIHWSGLDPHRRFGPRAESRRPVSGADGGVEPDGELSAVEAERSEPLGSLGVAEGLEGLEAGEIIEEYPDETPYPSCLVLGRTRAGRPLHVVCAPIPAEQRLIIITTYQPEPARWGSGFRRRRQP